MKNFEKNLRYKCKYEDLNKKFFEIRLHKINEGKQDVKTQVISKYCVDLYTLAIGPIHQSIELNSMVSEKICSHFNNYRTGNTWESSLVT